MFHLDRIPPPYKYHDVKRGMVFCLEVRGIREGVGVKISKKLCYIFRFNCSLNELIGTTAHPWIEVLCLHMLFTCMQNETKRK